MVVALLGFTPAAVVGLEDCVDVVACTCPYDFTCTAVVVLCVPALVCPYACPFPFELACVYPLAWELVVAVVAELVLLPAWPYEWPLPWPLELLCEVPLVCPAVAAGVLVLA